MTNRALEDWHEYTYSILDEKAYRSASDETGLTMFLAAVNSGIRSIAEIDHLDTNLVESVIQKIAKKRLDIDLICIEKENKRHAAKVIYNVTKANSSGRVLYELQVRDLSSDRCGWIDIGYLDCLVAPYSIGTMTLNRNEVVIRGRKGMRAVISREHDGLPDEYRFAIDDVWDRPRTPGGKMHRIMG